MFRRRRKDGTTKTRSRTPRTTSRRTRLDDGDDDEPDAATSRPRRRRPTGPWDVGDAPDDGMVRLDLGSMRVPGAAGRGDPGQHGRGRPATSSAVTAVHGRLGAAAAGVRGCRAARHLGRRSGASWPPGSPRTAASPTWTSPPSVGRPALKAPAAVPAAGRQDRAWPTCGSSAPTGRAGCCAACCPGPRPRTPARRGDLVRGLPGHGRRARRRGVRAERAAAAAPARPGPGRQPARRARTGAGSTPREPASGSRRSARRSGDPLRPRAAASLVPWVRASAAGSSDVFWTGSPPPARSSRRRSCIEESRDRGSMPVGLPGRRAGHRDRHDPGPDPAPGRRCAGPGGRAVRRQRHDQAGLAGPAPHRRASTRAGRCRCTAGSPSQAASRVMFNPSYELHA